MLPFLRRKHQGASVIVKHRHPGGNIDELQDNEPSADPLDSVASDLLQAFENKDKNLIAQALRNAFDILESEPHNEGPHLNEEEE